MDQTLKEAAETGNVSELYELIQRDGNVLRRFDEVEFIDTPLNTATENGCIGFAMEIMSLKPSFARKLNHQGLSPLHLAVEKEQVKMALRLVEVDKDLVRVRGKNGETPFHYLSKVENRHGMLDRFVEACPECIRDVTSRNCTALHVAVENNKPDVLKVLIGLIRKKEYYEEVVNRQDEDGNTALHIAATNNQPQMLRILLECKADKHVSNDNKKTALDVAHDTESISILGGCFSPKISKSIYDFKKKMVKYVRKASSALIFLDMDDISFEDRNALLVVLGLILTTTYQATLSPPGGLWQGDSSNSNSTDSQNIPGTTVMDQVEFLFFYIPTFLAFIVSVFLTLVLLKPYPSGFRTALQVLLAFLAVCFYSAIINIAPPFDPKKSINGIDSALGIIIIFSAIVFFLMVFMFIAYDISKISVSIVAYWILPISLVVGELWAAIVEGMLLFLFLYDEFWKGTILVVCYSLYEITAYLINLDISEALLPTVLLVGIWLFLHLCQFCIKHRTRFCNLLLCNCN